MKLPRMRFTVRRMMVAVAVFALLVYEVAIPVWDYYSLPPGTRAVLGMLDQPVRMPSAGPTTLVTLLKSIKSGTAGPKNNGVPIFVDPAGLAEAGAGVGSTFVATTGPRPVKEHLERSLRPLGLGYFVKDGLLTVTSAKSADRALMNHPKEARRP